MGPIDVSGAGLQDRHVGGGDANGRRALEEAGTRRLRQLVIAARTSAALALAIAAVVLVGGWVMGHPEVARCGFGELPTMKANAAIGIALAAIALCLPVRQWSGFAMASGAAVAALGAAILVEWWSGSNLHIDELIFRDATAIPPDPPGRAYVITALSFVALGLAIVLIRSGGTRRVTAAQALAMASGVASLVSDFGYMARGVAREGLAGAVSQPLLAAVSLTLLSFAALTTAPDDGFMATVTSRLIGGSVARRMVWIALGVVSALAITVRIGADAGWYEDAFGTSLLAALVVPALLSVIWFVAAQANEIDVSREVTQLALAESEAGFRSLFLSSPVALHLEDLSAVKRYVDSIGSAAAATSDPSTLPEVALEVASRAEVVDANTTALAMLGALSTDRARSLTSHLEPAAAPAYLATLVHAIAEGRTSFDTETSIVTRGGARKTVQVRSAALPGHEASYDRIIVAFADVTAQREAERVLRDSRVVLEESVRERTEELEVTAEQLRTSNEELQRFAYVASHDLQEPLRKIVSFSDLLAEEVGDSLGEDARGYVERVTDASRRLQQLIEDLLTYSRAGGSIELEAVSADMVLHRALDALSAAVEESGAVVTHDPLPEVMANATQLQQVFQNLIGNAIKYRGVNPPTIHVTAEHEGDHRRISVTDNGIGFEAEYSDQIFVIFQRLHGKARYGGTGIGLALAKRIVEGHGGRIWAESEPGRGSTFIFTLTAASTSSAATEPSPEVGGTA